jgi:hypothetical protein
MKKLTDFKGIGKEQSHTGCGLASRNLTFVVSRHHVTRRSFIQTDLR